MMLFDGAVRFAEQGRSFLVAQNWEQSYTNFSRSQKIIAELTSSLKHDVNPELCGRLASLYNYAYRKLIEANVDHTVEAADEGIRVLKYQRETWALLLDQIGKQKAALVAQRLDAPAPSDRMESSIRMSA